MIRASGRTARTLSTIRFTGRTQARWNMSSSRTPDQESNICTASAPGLQAARSDTPPTRPPADPAARQKPLDGGRRTAGQGPDPACHARRSYRSPPSTARRRSRAGPCQTQALRGFSAPPHRRAADSRETFRAKARQSPLAGSAPAAALVPSENVSLRPSACGTTRMSENRIAASKPKRRIGCMVTSVASSGSIAEIQKAPGLLPHLAVFRQIAPGLAHHPDWRRIDGLSVQHSQNRLALSIQLIQWLL